MQKIQFLERFESKIVEIVFTTANDTEKMAKTQKVVDEQYKVKLFDSIERALSKDEEEHTTELDKVFMMRSYSGSAISSHRNIG